MDFQLLNPLRWRKSFLILVLGGFMMIWLAFFDTYSLWTRFQLSQRKDTLMERKQQLKEETTVLKQKIENLKNDPTILERIAREQYGMKKKGETIYKIREVD